MKHISVHFIFPLIIAGILSTLTSCEDTHRFDDLVYGEKWLIASETTIINDTTYYFIKQNDSKVWELFGGTIDGFYYEPDHEYLIAVKRVENNTINNIGDKYSFNTSVKKYRTKS